MAGEIVQYNRHTADIGLLPKQNDFQSSTSRALPVVSLAQALSTSV